MAIADLSERQLEIARTVATNSYEDSARILGMTPRNVRYHTQQIMAKIGAQRKSDIANILLWENQL